MRWAFLLLPGGGSAELALGLDRTWTQYSLHPVPSGAFTRFQVSCLPLPAAPLLLFLMLCDWEHLSCSGRP